MRKILPAILSLSCAASALALNFTAEDGQVLKDARLLKVSKGTAYISHEDGLAALTVTPALAEAFQIKVSEEPLPSANLLKTEVENWLLEVKNASATYRPPPPTRPVRQQTAPEPEQKKAKVKKPTNYLAEQFAAQYVPAEDNGRYVVVSGLVTAISGKKSQFKIVLNDAVTYTYYTSVIAKSFDTTGNPKAIGPYAVGQNATLNGYCQGKDASGCIIITE